MVPLKNLEILRNPHLERISGGWVNEYINTYRSFVLIINNDKNYVQISFTQLVSCITLLCARHWCSNLLLILKYGLGG